MYPFICGKNSLFFGSTTNINKPLILSQKFQKSLVIMGEYFRRVWFVFVEIFNKLTTNCANIYI